MFENRVLRGIFGPERDEIKGKWRKLYNEGLNDLYCSHNCVLLIKSRRTRWVGLVARMGRGEGRIGFWWGSLREKGHLEDPGLDERIILR